MLLVNLEGALGTIITVATQKGGAGKTTLTRILSVNLATEGWKVAVIDADPNKGFSEWAQVYTGPSLSVHTEPDEKKLANLPADLAEQYDADIIDTAGFGSRSMLVAIGAADGVIGKEAKVLSDEIIALGWLKRAGAKPASKKSVIAAD